MKKANTLSYKNKNKLLALCTVIFGMVIYFGAIKNTIALYKENLILTSALGQAKQAPIQMKELALRAATIQSKFSSFVRQEHGTREKILAAVSLYCQKNRIKLKDFPEVDPAQKNDITVETNIFVAEGNFQNLLNLLYHLEYENKLARVSSARFETYIDHKQKKEILSMKVYLQNIRIKPPTQIL